MKIRYSLTRKLTVNLTRLEFWMTIERPGRDGWYTAKVLTFWRKV